jgi:hypothetical protein
LRWETTNVCTISPGDCESTVPAATWRTYSISLSLSCVYRRLRWLDRWAQLCSW